MLPAVRVIDNDRRQVGMNRNDFYDGDLLAYLMFPGPPAKRPCDHERAPFYRMGRRRGF